jgi:hypothetical protein
MGPRSDNRGYASWSSAVIRPVLITAGHDVTPDGPGFRVPKLELVGAVTALLESGRLAIPRSIPEAQTLGRELQAFRALLTAAGRACGTNRTCPA